MSEKAKCTPGPWSVHRLGRLAGGRAVVAYHVLAPNSGERGDVALFDQRTSAENEANATLLSVARETAAERDRLRAVNAELSAALLEIRDTVLISSLCPFGGAYYSPSDGGRQPYKHCTCNYHAAARRLDAAIARAERRS